MLPFRAFVGNIKLLNLYICSKNDVILSVRKQICETTYRKKFSLQEVEVSQKLAKKRWKEYFL